MTSKIGFTPLATLLEEEQKGSVSPKTLTPRPRTPTNWTPSHSPATSERSTQSLNGMQVSIIRPQTPSRTPSILPNGCFQEDDICSKPPQFSEGDVEAKSDERPIMADQENGSTDDSNQCLVVLAHIEGYNPMKRHCWNSQKKSSLP